MVFSQVVRPWSPASQVGSKGLSYVFTRNPEFQRLSVLSMQSKPLEGAEKDGAIGFFKGIGKGFVGYGTLGPLSFHRLNLSFNTVLLPNLPLASSTLHQTWLKVGRNLVNSS